MSTDNGIVSSVAGSDIASTASRVAHDYQPRKPPVTYLMGGDASNGGKASDCSRFVHDVLAQVGLNIHMTTTEMMALSPEFRAVTRATAQAGDIIVQGRHMGIYTGRSDSQVRPLGIQMGDHGARTGPWGPGGWFAKGDDMRFYRPIGVL